MSNISERVGEYLAGFVDGEGSFNVTFRPRGDYRQPWKISLCFNISQRDETVLVLFKQLVQCGTMRQRADGVWYYEANSLASLRGHVIPFFERFGFRSKKKTRDFAKFRELAALVASGRHLTYDGVLEVLEIRREMNDGGKRRYSDAEIVERFRQRRILRDCTPDPLSVAAMRQSELRGDAQSG